MRTRITGSRCPIPKSICKVASIILKTSSDIKTRVLYYFINIQNINPHFSCNLLSTPDSPAPPPVSAHRTFSLRTDFFIQFVSAHRTFLLRTDFFLQFVSALRTFPLRTDFFLQIVNAHKTFLPRTDSTVPKAVNSHRS